MKNAIFIFIILIIAFMLNAGEAAMIMDDYFREMILLFPEEALKVGLTDDMGYSYPRDKLNSAATDMAEKEMNIIKKYNDKLIKVDLKKADEDEMVSAEMLLWYFNLRINNEKFLYHTYAVNHMFGPFSATVSGLTDYHPINNEPDAENFISKLYMFPLKMKEWHDDIISQAVKGIMPPAIIFERQAEIINDFINTPVTDNPVYTAFVEKSEEAGIKHIPEMKKEASSIISDSIIPVLKDVVLLLDSLRTRAGDDAGTWHLPEGKDYYSYCLKYHTTTSFTPDEVYNIGLSEVARIQHEIRMRFKELGFDTTGNFKECVWAYWNRANPAEGNNTLFFKAESPAIIDEYNSIINDTYSRLPDFFSILPKAKVHAEAIPVYKRKSIGAHYESASIDGSRDAVFFASTQYDAYIPAMATLTYHETVPGHHLQIALEQELNQRFLFRTLFFFTGYVEGWALYAEKLAYENKWHKDVYSEIEYLFSELFRAVRLVVDTGIHSKEWTRERAFSYMESSMGWGSYNEIDRYIVWPGQACSYKMGELKLVELRKKAMDKLGKKFSIKDFHSYVLNSGSLPLEILEGRIDTYIKTAK